jgi:Na+/H+-dicarboxylate symporter
LDRCRTTINVLGDMNVACLLDGKDRESSAPEAVELEPKASEAAVAPAP